MLLLSCVCHAFESVNCCLVGKGLTSLLLFVMFNCAFASFSCGILGQVRYLILSIPNLCRLSYFQSFIDVIIPLRV